VLPGRTSSELMQVVNPAASANLLPDASRGKASATRAARRASSLSGAYLDAKHDMAAADRVRSPPCQPPPAKRVDLQPAPQHLAQQAAHMAKCVPLGPPPPRPPAHGTHLDVQAARARRRPRLVEDYLPSHLEVDTERLLTKADVPFLPRVFEAYATLAASGAPATCH
jgi:hypothetical protein